MQHKETFSLEYHYRQSSKVEDKNLRSSLKETINVAKEHQSQGIYLNNQMCPFAKRIHKRNRQKVYSFSGVSKELKWMEIVCMDSECQGVFYEHASLKHPKAFVSLFWLLFAFFLHHLHTQEKLNVSLEHMKRLDKIIQSSSRYIIWKNIEDFKSQVIWFSDFSLRTTGESKLLDRSLQVKNEVRYVVKTTTAVSCKQCQNPFLKMYFSQKSAAIYCEICKKHLLKS